MSLHDHMARRAQSHITTMANSPPPGNQIVSSSSQTEQLGRDLLRCQEQLNLVFETTSHIANLQEPEQVENTLLHRYASVLAAGVLFMDHNGCCQRILPTESPPQDSIPPLDTDVVRATLAEHIELVRQARRTVIAPLTTSEKQSLAGAQVVLGTLQRDGGEPAVLIALRTAHQAPYEHDDVLASESVLGYGTQVLANLKLIRDLQRSALETVCTLVNAIDAKDNYTSDHSERVGGYARLVGSAMGLNQEQLQALEWAGLLHDVGKIGIPEKILNKPGALTRIEFEEMKRHVRIGHDVLKPVTQFDPVLNTVLYHHENHDGSGYPDGLKSSDVPLEARIIHIVDIFDALTTTRPYRRKFTVEQAFETLEDGIGRVTEPDVTRLFIDTLQAFMADHPTEFHARFGRLARDDTVSAQAI